VNGAGELLAAIPLSGFDTPLRTSALSEVSRILHKDTGEERLILIPWRSFQDIVLFIQEKMFRTIINQTEKSHPTNHRVALWMINYPGGLKSQSEPVARTCSKCIYLSIKES